MKKENIRNFCIIAHIDHGKSTLADRLLELTNTIEKRKLKERVLDSLELEQEKGITIKLKAVCMDYVQNGVDYQLNLIDTPGHVDFSYEVSRSLAACEGALLVVDASQGIQAQTVSNVYKALEAGLTIVPVLNKTDLPNASLVEVKKDLADTFGFSPADMFGVSAKTGEGVQELLDQLIKKIPPPKGSVEAPTRALIFDTFYDEFLGVVAIVKVVDGYFDSQDFKKNRKISFLATGATSKPEGLGIFKPFRQPQERLSAGEVGFISTGLKDIKKVKVGDTVGLEDQNPKALPGYKEIKPFVFVSMYPTQNNKFGNLRTALEKMALSDSSLSFEPETSQALGFGFRCGFLGLLHADIIQERLEREYNLTLISTTPTVEYKIHTTAQETMWIRSAADFPDASKIESVEEPWIATKVVSPARYVGGIITLCEERRGVMIKMEYPTETRVVFEYELPLSELVYNFYDDLKTASSGFASLDYQFLGYKTAAVVKMDILVHGEAVPPLSHIVLKEKADLLGRDLLKKLKAVIPRQQYKVPLQAVIGGRVLAREDIPAVRKNVLAGISGGHRERKDKLLERQKRGKERLKRVGKIDIPQEAFRQMLKS